MSNIITTIKQTTTKWASNMARMGEDRIHRGFW